MKPAPIRLVPRKPKSPPRFHISVAKPGCWCSKCGKLRGPADHLRSLIELYEARLVVFREELARELAK